MKELTTLQKLTMMCHCSIAFASSRACTSSQHSELRFLWRPAGGATWVAKPEATDLRLFSFITTSPPQVTQFFTLALFMNVQAAHLHRLFSDTGVKKDEGFTSDATPSVTSRLDIHMLQTGADGWFSIVHSTHVHILAAPPTREHSVLTLERGDFV